jgi:hypothetical protein
LTLIGGFAVLAASPFPLLRDFGIINALNALNALVALLSAQRILPPLLMRADRHARIGGFQLGPADTHDALASPSAEPVGVA